MPTERNNGFRWFIIALSILGSAILLISTRSGPGINTDSVEYMFAAKSVLHGNGLQGTSFELNGWKNTPLTLYPPLYPLLLAPFAAIGIDLLTAARLINAVSFALVLYGSGYLILTYIKSRVLMFLAFLSIFLSVPVWRAFIMALSEPVFILLLTWFCIVMIQFLKSPRMSTLLLASLVAALSCLQRYAGAATILTGVVTLLSPMMKFPPVKRLRYIVTFVVLSCAPLLAWFTGTFLMTSQIGGSRRAGTATIGSALVNTIDWATTWFMPSAIPLLLRCAIVIVVILAAGAIIVFYSPKSGMGPVAPSLPSLGPLLSPVVLLMSYMGFLIVAGLVTYIDPIWDRFLSPIVIIVYLLIFILIEAISRRITLPLKGNSLRFAIISLSVVWIAYPAVRFSVEIVGNLRGDLGIYDPFDTPRFRDSPLTQWVKANASVDQVYSNAPDVLFVLTGVNARYSPTLEMDITKFRNDMPLGPSYLVWFKGIREDKVSSFPGDAPSPLQLPKDFIASDQVELVQDTFDGQIYRFK